MGYSRAGFEVVGIDNVFQKRYPFEFHQADAFEYLAEHGREFDVIHASPVCKGYTTLKALHPEKIYPDQIAGIRKLLIEIGKPYIIENIETAPLYNYVMLCGSMFGLQVYRHRLFECMPRIWFPPGQCNHLWRASGNKPPRGKKRCAGNLTNWNILTVAGHDFIVADARKAMGIDWMIQKEISQAVPPAYTEWIGKQMMKIFLYNYYSNTINDVIERARETLSLEEMG